MTHSILVPAIVVATLMGGDVAAQDAPSFRGVDAATPVDSLILTALAEHQVFQSCIALHDGDGPGIVSFFWQDMAANALAQIDAAGYTSAAVDLLRATPSAADVRLPDDTPFGEVIALCRANEGWQRNLNFLEWVELEKVIGPALDALPAP